MLVRKCRRQVRKIAKLGRENLDFTNQPSMTQRIQPTPPHRIGKMVRSRRKTQQFLVRVPTHVLPDALYRPDCVVCVQQAIQCRIRKINEGDKAAWQADIPVERGSPSGLFQWIARDELGPYRADHVQARNIPGVVFRSIDAGQRGIVADHRRETGTGLGEHAVAHQVTIVEVLVTVDDLKLAGHSW